MKRRTLGEIDHSRISWGIKTILQFSEICGMELHFKLADRMAERGLSVRGLSALSGLRLATIHDIMNGNRTSINLQHLTVLMTVLRLTKLSDLIEIHLPEYLTHHFDQESAEWIASGEPPASVSSFKFLHTIEEEQQNEFLPKLEHQFKVSEKVYQELKEEFEGKKKGSI